MSEIDLGRYPGIYRRGSTWYVKKRVPIDLRHVEKREQIALSLGTTDPREAERRYPFRLADIERRFHELRSELAAQGPVQAALRIGRLELLSDADIENLAGDWFRKRAPLREPSFDTLDARTIRDRLADDENRIRTPEPHDMDPAESAANRLLLDAGIAAKTRKLGRSRTQAPVPVVDRSTSQYGYLVNLVRRSLLADIAVSRDQLEGGQKATFDPLFNPDGVRPPNLPLTASTSAAMGHRTVADLVREYGRYREASYDRESTDRKYKLLFRALGEALGSDFAVAAIKTSDCAKVKALLDDLPPNISKRFRGFTLSEAATARRQKGLPAMAATTVGGYGLKEYEAEFGWIDQIKHVREPKVLEQATAKLVAALSEALKLDPTEVEDLHLAYPAIYDPEKLGWVRFRGFGFSEIYPDLEIAHYLAGLKAKGIAAYEEAYLDSHSVQECDETGKVPGQAWKLRDCVVFETELDGRRYVISGGRWYGIDENLAKEVEQYFASSAKVQLPPALAGENEEKYNKRIAGLATDMICLDTKLLKPSDAYSPIETCDFFSEAKAFIHVKDKTASSRLSHLFNQGAVSAVTFKRDGSFRSRLKKLVEDQPTGAKFAALIPDETQKIVAADFTVIFGVLANAKVGKDPRLPFFSMVSFRQAARHISDELGYNVAFAWVRKGGAGAGKKPVRAKKAKTTT